MNKEGKRERETWRRPKGPFGLLVLVLDYAEVAAAHVETIKTSRAGPLTSHGGPFLQALLNKVLPLLGMTFEDLKNSTLTGNSL